ncbi:MAG TPA: isoprenyl transferase [Cytophagales bacterium]|jgi:undecaprenyl diphosphate synthase|nr:isoprenyl transferase [Cytophagales bacterium]
MDGNGRWAKQRGAARIFGHKNALKAVRDTVEGCAELGIGFLTLYAFSTENWNRPVEEVNALMSLLISTIRSEAPTLKKNNIRLATIGATSSLPNSCQKELKEAIELTSTSTGTTVVLALSYSSRWEIVEAVKQVAQEVNKGNLSVEDIDAELFSSYLDTKNIPDPELIIRTSGENRLSNFLLWQAAYSELYISPILWPDFRKEHLHEAIVSFQGRERRFGKISEQLVRSHS